MVVSKEEAKKRVAELVKKYESLSQSDIKGFNEEKTKQWFIRPLFEALGWDFEKDVHPEDKASKGRVDYAFKMGDIPKFFLEAKKLSVDLDEERWAKQAIDYAWHKNVIWAVLCDFEGIKVFNAEVKTTNYVQSGLYFLNYTQYLDRFDDLWLLSKESFEKGLIHNEAEKRLKKLKKIPVDKQLLSDLTMFRESLSKDLMSHNAGKFDSEDELDESVQRILDRLIFIRTCESRELEPQSLIPLVREDTHKRIYKKLGESFARFNETYNSKLFEEHLCDQLVISDDVLERIIKGLFQTQDGTVRYDFSLIDADVLGNMYEQYLGHILKKTPKRAKLTSGKAHRKEQGIYYTPTYVVDYIVKNTIGELAKDKKADLSKIKVLDPACGSGSFLMKAFDYLVALDKKKNGDIDQTKLDFTGESVTYGRKLEILKNNIFGVDLDPKAVEIAQLNLLLKAAEKKHRLPTLQENLKVGNSLIDDSEVAGDKTFNWEKEFKDIMAEGGFDVVIGNPPYVRQEQLDKYKKGFEKYKIYDGTSDIYTYFFERAINLLKEGGYFAFIVSSKFTRTKYGRKLRDFILDNTQILQFIDFGELPVFQDATTYPCIIILKKTGNAKTRKSNKIIFSKVKSLNFKNLQDEVQSNQNIIKQSEISSEGWVFKEKADNKLKTKIEKNTVDLYSFVKGKLFRGITTGCNEAFIIDEKTKNSLIKKDKKSEEIIKKFIFGKNIKRYSVEFDDNYLIFAYTGINITKYPAVREHLMKFKSKLDKVWEVKHKKHPWYELRGCKYYSEFECDKIIFPDIASENRFSYDVEKHFCGNTAYIVPFKEKYLVGILNSKVIEYYFKQISTMIRGGFYRYIASYVKNIPIKKNMPQSFKTKLNNLVERRIDLSKELRKVHDKQTDSKARLEREIEELDDQIDQEVYKLYGLTKDEIRIVEGSLK